jgi:hypothetical protein
MMFWLIIEVLRESTVENMRTNSQYKEYYNAIKNFKCFGLVESSGFGLVESSGFGLVES